VLAAYRKHVAERATESIPPKPLDPEDSISEYLNSNITLLRWMVNEGYGDPRTLERRAQAMEACLAEPTLMKGATDAEYAAIIEIDLAEINKSIVCCPTTPMTPECCLKLPVPRSMKCLSVLV
jgi:aconitase B